jgi:nucleoside-diphosphate-sugar epimerase
MLNILITGHRGFIGQHMVNALSDHNLSFYDWGSTY